MQKASLCLCAIVKIVPLAMDPHDFQEELAAMAPTRDWRLIEVDSDLDEVDRHR